jgi:hypothetical protein
VILYYLLESSELFLGVKLLAEILVFELRLLGEVWLRVALDI